MADQTVKTYIDTKKRRVNVDRIETPTSSTELAVTFTVTIDGASKPFSGEELRQLINTAERALQGA
jgi:hypothetical protein